MHRISTLLPCSLILSFVSTNAPASMLVGEFVLDGKAFSPKQIAAFRTQRSSDKGKYLTMVLLTAKDVDSVNIGSPPYAYEAAINDPTVKGSDYIVVWVEKGGQVTINAIIGDQQFNDTTGAVAGAPGNLIANCPNNKPEVVTCQVQTKNQVKTLSGHTYTLDVAFSDESVIVRKP